MSFCGFLPLQAHHYSTGNIIFLSKRLFRLPANSWSCAITLSTVWNLSSIYGISLLKDHPGAWKLRLTDHTVMMILSCTSKSVPVLAHTFDAMTKTAYTLQLIPMLDTVGVCFLSTDIFSDGYQNMYGRTGRQSKLIQESARGKGKRTIGRKRHVDIL